MRHDPVKKYPGACLMLISLLMLMPHLGLIPTNIMEARNLITAREMVDDHHWIFTTLNNFPRYEKPPLPTWLTAAAGSVFGFSNMFFLRLPVALIALLLVYFFYKLLKRFLPGNSAAFHSSLVLITSFYIVFSGRDNQWDMYAHAFMAGSIYFLVRAFQKITVAHKEIVLAALFFGCSFLSKGPVAPYALFLPFLQSYFIVYSNAWKRNLLITLAVITVGLLIGFSWPLYVRYFDAGNVAAAAAQEAGRWGGYNARPFWYYWSFVSQSGIWTLPAFIGLLYPYMKSRVSNLKAYRFAILWTLFSVVLLSVVPEKKARYLLPLLIPLAMNTGFYVEYLFARFREITNRKELTVINFAFGVIGIVALFLPAALIIILKTQARDYLFWLVAGSAVSAFCGLAIIGGLYRKKFNTVFYGIIFFMCGISCFLIPVSKAFFQNEKNTSAAALHLFEQKYGIKTYELHGFTPEVIWNYGSSIPEITKNDKWNIPTEPAFGLLIIPGEKALLEKNIGGYTFQRLSVIDLNAVPSSSKSHNVRLVKHYYLVEKKTTLLP